MVPTAQDGHGSVLLVDDDPDILESLRDFLEVEGFVVAVAISGRQALERLERYPAPSIVLLDMRMPLMDGWAVLNFLRERPGLAAIPVAACTADTSIRVEGVVATLRKPFDIDDVLQLLRRYCA